MSFPFVKVSLKLIMTFPFVKVSLRMIMSDIYFCKFLS
jgi:hypothetical protein